MKKSALYLIAFILIITVVLTACGSSEYEIIGDVGLLEMRQYYRVQSFPLDFDFDIFQGNFFLHQEQLHFYSLYIDEVTGNTGFILLTLDADGTNERKLFRTVLDEKVDFLHIIGFEKHDNNYISLVTHDSVVLPPYTREDALLGEASVDIEYSHTYVYRRISPDGTIVSVTGIDALNNEQREFGIFEVAFDLDGNAVASVHWFPADLQSPPEDFNWRSFFLFDNGITGDFHEVVDGTLSAGSFNRTYSGQIIVPNYVWSPATDLIMFHKVDFENVAIVDGPLIEAESSIGQISGVFPAPVTSVFDFYFIGNGQEVVGYRESDGSFTTLINFIDLGVSLNAGLGRGSFLPWDDGQITIADRSWNSSSRRFDITLFLLTPGDEPWLPYEREIITLGGIDINTSPLMDQAAQFNRQSLTHRIEVINYTHSDMERLRIELMTGRGPDIFKLSWFGADFVAALSEGVFMLDLYQMIDADPYLQREDFFPSILSTWENSRGELVKLAPNFSMLTIMGMSSTFPSAPEEWTYADFIKFYQEARAAGYSYPLGVTLDRLYMLDKLLFADDTFFSEKDGTANFDSDSFINVLNFVLTIPADQGWERISDNLSISGWDPESNLLRGEQLLIPFASIRCLRHFRELRTRLGGFTAFGFPSSDAPVHAVQAPLGTAIGIRANSPHIEAAWEFARISLLPGVFQGDNVFPTRVDMFEQVISNELDRAAPMTAFWEGNSVEVPPLTEADAELLRELVANIGHTPIIEHPVQNIVREDVLPFFAGQRSAEDTARIIQSRVQILLAERVR
ncbi:MAG: extracellular solute-binding protein [Oscillospiraceae bacterium]|nr:extracellular solute-binding protein [Oscillospiraceae bacterium]MCL2279371.1 extracellular solute-binding protein [Oscillospiraceae bacterium]